MRKAFMDDLLDQVVDAVLVCDADQRTTFANKEASELIGYSTEELLGRSVADLIDLSQIDRSNTPCIRDGEGLVTRRDGSTVPVSISMAPLPCSGDETGTVFILRDISQRKSAEQRLVAQLGLLQSTIDSTGEGILVLDRDRRIALYNRKAAEMWNLPAEIEQKGNDREMLLHAIHQLADPAAFLEHARRPDWLEEEELRDVLQLSDGRVFERYSMPHASAGGIVGRIWSFRDVTQTRETQRAIER